MPEYWAVEGTLSEREISRLLSACGETRYPARNRAIVLLACDAGLTPKEISWLKRYSVQTDDGLVGDHISLAGKKGKRLVPRRIPIARNGRLRNAIIEVLGSFPGTIDDPLIVSERELYGSSPDELPGLQVFQEMRPTSIGYIMWKLANRAGISMDGGRDARRTFIVKVGRRMKDAGGTARDVQTLAGHRSLESTQRLLEADWAAQTRVIGTLFDDPPKRA
jgi:integrase